MIKETWLNKLRVFAVLSQKWFVDIIGNQGIYKTRSLALLMGEIVVLNKNLVITQIWSPGNKKGTKIRARDNFNLFLQS